MVRGRHLHGIGIGQLDGQRVGDERVLRVHRLVARAQEVPDRNAAEALQGYEVAVARAERPAAEADEYYWDDLVGLEVVNQTDERLGRVAELVRAGAHEVLDVRDEDGSQRLLPFVAAVIKEVDLAGRRIRVDWGRDW